MGSSAAARLPSQVAATVDTIARLSRLVSRVLSDLDEPMTVRQLRVLTRLQRGDAAISRLAARSGVHAPSMSQTIDGMVDRGWVLREEDPTDRRRRTIRLTPAGRESLAAAQRSLTAQLSEVLAGVSDDEAEALTRGLAAVGRELDRRWQQIIERTGG